MVMHLVWVAQMPNCIHIITFSHTVYNKYYKCNSIVVLLGYKLPLCTESIEQSLYSSKTLNPQLLNLKHTIDILT
jgi:hypothetical protein